MLRRLDADRQLIDFEVYVRSSYLCGYLVVADRCRRTASRTVAVVFVRNSAYPDAGDKL